MPNFRRPYANALEQAYNVFISRKRFCSPSMHFVAELSYILHLGNVTSLKTAVLYGHRRHRMRLYNGYNETFRILRLVPFDISNLSRNV